MAICTNNFLETRDFWQAGLPLDLFDAIMVSCDLGVRKPDPEMYEHVSRTLQIRAEAIVLLDDLAANIAGARRAGWQTVLVGADPQQAIDELDRLLAQDG